MLITRYSNDEMHVYDLSKASSQNPIEPRKIIRNHINVKFGGFVESPVFRFNEDLNKIFFSEKGDRGKIWNYDFN